MAREREYPAWQERWRRRGELLTIASIAGLFASFASGSWAQIGAALFGLVVGVYVIAAADAGWWLPGRKAVLERDEQRFRWSGLPIVGSTSPDATAIVDELKRLNRLLHEVLKPAPPPPWVEREQEEKDDDDTTRPTE
jgi:hypothetical protein